MKKILVATDASDYSRRALTTAVGLAQQFNAEIELLFVMYNPIIYSFGAAESYVAPQDQVERDGNLALEATIKGIDLSGVTLKQKKLPGNPANVILQEAEDENIDLIVMGSHGYGAIVGSMLGSVSQKVLHRAKCSVLIAR